MEDKFKCPRCGGTGEIVSCRHVCGGVCFECLGTKLSFRLRLRECERRLTALRKAYKVSPARRVEITARGKALVERRDALVAKREGLKQLCAR